MTVPARAESGLLVFNARLVDRDLDVPGAVLALDGKIAVVYAGKEFCAPNAAEFAASETLSAAGAASGGSLRRIDARGAVLMPAFVDLHAHFRDPGFTQKEDVSTASCAAAAGGYGTVVLMANTSPVISSERDARAVNDRVRGRGLVDSFQAVSLTRGFDGADTAHLESLDARVVPVASEDGREVASAAVMLGAMKACAARGVIVSCHCEDPSLAAAARPFRSEALAAAKAGLPLERSASLARAERLLRLAEDTMTARNLALAAEARCRVHIAHVSTAGSLAAVRAAKREACAEAGQSAVDGERSRSADEPGSCVPGGAARRLGRDGVARVTCEVTPHHLSLTDASLEIVNPPLRGEADRQALVAGLLDGTVDAISTDHAPHTAEDKAAGAPGFSGIQTAFQVCNTALVKTGIVGLSKLSALMSANPARMLGLDRGLLEKGYDADLVLVDPDAVVTVDSEDAASWFSRGKNTPFAGARLSGKIIATVKRGRVVYENGRITV